ncbi:MAG: hypothetical protein KDK36_16005 [Leptospiraceae bacterium]|nr:hypothetical protein [Leptospiraceae bacterium]
MGNLINNIYLGFFNLDEFKDFYNEIQSKGSEFFISLIAGFSLAISTSLLNDSNSFAIVIFKVIEFYALVNYFPEIYFYFISFKINKPDLDNKREILKSILKVSNAIFILSTPIAIILKSLSWDGASGLILMYIFLFTIYYSNVYKALISIYEFENNEAFKLVFSSLFLTINIPIVLVIFYLYFIGTLVI